MNTNLTGIVQEVDYEGKRVLIAQKWHNVVGKAQDFLDRIKANAMIEFAMDSKGSITYIVPYAEKPKINTPVPKPVVKSLEERKVEALERIAVAFEKVIG